MADTPKDGETVTPGDSQTTVQPAAAPVANAADPAEVERLRKEADQAKMAASQARNELEKIKAEQEAAQKKQLEENEQFKDLWEKERIEKENLIREREETQRKAELEAATNSLFKDYSPAVQELARTAGLSLTDDSETATAELKSKLDVFKSTVGTARVEPNNPAPSATPTPDREQAIKVMRMNNVPNSARAAATKKAIGGLEAVKAMNAMNGRVIEEA